jgi:hypothetical protein
MIVAQSQETLDKLEIDSIVCISKVVTVLSLPPFGKHVSAGAFASSLGPKQAIDNIPVLLTKLNLTL